MIKRIVFWNVKGNTPGQIHDNAVRIKELLESLSGKIPGMSGVEVGINIHDSADACDIAFIAEFDSDLSIKEYDSHPEHEKIKPEIMHLRTERYVVVFEL